MAYDVLSLIDDDKPEPICVYKSDSIITAINLMRRHNYSQLPIINDSDEPQGVITYESIVTALRSQNSTPKQLNVIDAMRSVEHIKHEADLNACLDILKVDNVALVVENGKIIQIVTTYDAMEFFQKKTQDMLWVEDIESSIKEFIEIATFNIEGETDEDLLSMLIARVTRTGEELQGRILNLVTSYIEETAGQEAELDYLVYKDLSEKHLPVPETKLFDDLSFFEYSQLFLLNEIWNHYQESFSQGKDKLREMLGKVGDSRNYLAHFRGELPKHERDHLLYMRDWLFNQEIPESIYLPVGDVAKETIHQIQEEQADYNWRESIQPIDEEIDRKYSKYAPLAAYLYSQSGKFKRLELTFAEIEGIIGDELPISARDHTAWWANDSVGHSHSIQWLNAGWRVSYKNLREEKVTFVRIKEREKAYIDFYNNLHLQLLNNKQTPLKKSSPNGANWYTIAKVPEIGKQQAVFGFSFTWEKQFRVELYIDTGEQKKNKAIFASLNNELKGTLINDEDITWEEIPGKRASRIAIYCEGSIDQDDQTLNSLRSWAMETMNQFYEIFNPVVNKAIEEI